MQSRWSPHRRARPLVPRCQAVLHQRQRQQWRPRSHLPELRRGLQPPLIAGGSLHGRRRPAPRQIKIGEVRYAPVPTACVPHLDRLEDWVRRIPERKEAARRKIERGRLNAEQAQRQARRDAVSNYHRRLEHHNSGRPDNPAPPKRPRLDLTPRHTPSTDACPNCTASLAACIKCKLLSCPRKGCAGQGYDLLQRCADHNDEIFCQTCCKSASTTDLLRPDCLPSMMRLPELSGNREDSEGLVLGPGNAGMISHASELTHKIHLRSETVLPNTEDSVVELDRLKCICGDVHSNCKAHIKTAKSRWRGGCGGDRGCCRSCLERTFNCKSECVDDCCEQGYHEISRNDRGCPRCGGYFFNENDMYEDLMDPMGDYYC
ncbi:hypothetical protein B0T22DRAFT_165287 [Podospora appendiculata]|uniref:Uncharacterized protein n=1 Tax=Podospora appendiculata TaxID=314037 RepID=A0AAE0XAC9_9PEZI|nr:hypothetical protein B0T22DRAFT_165287 [Podospora appendiculata]